MLIYQKLIKREDLQKNKRVLYIFGDNESRIGSGGQAGEMRGEPNAVGVCTLYKQLQVFTDQRIYYNIIRIIEDFKPAVAHLDNGGVVVFPLDGIGTGIADLQNNAPRTLRFIQYYVKHLERKYK